MRKELLDILICPHCGSDFVCEPTDQRGDEIDSGTLRCCCGFYPIVASIPRLLSEHWQPLLRNEAPSLPTESVTWVLERTRASFGYQWTTFGKMSESFEGNFLNYVAPNQPSFFPRKLGLDAGCGFGRHMHQAARYGAEMVGLDASQAIDVARRNAGSERTHFVQGDLLNPPFRDGVFDLVYCLGVLHHLPEPEAGFRSLQRLCRDGGALWIWVYSKRRRVLNFLLERARAVTTRIPFPLLKMLCYIAGAIDYAFFIVPSRRLLTTPLGRWVPPRLALYAEYPFQVTVADWFDRLSAPVRFYYDERDLAAWAQRAGWSRYRIEPTGLYGFRLQREEEIEAPCVA